MADQGYKLWMIGHVNGVSLFNMKISDETMAVTTFTESDLAISFLNKKKIRNTLLRNFGKRIVLVGTTIMHMQNMVNPANHEYLSNIIINPHASGDFFIPLPMSYINNLVEKNILEYDPDEDADYDIIELIYDYSKKEYLDDSDTGVIF